MCTIKWKFWIIRKFPIKSGGGYRVWALFLPHKKIVSDRPAEFIVPLNLNILQFSFSTSWIITLVTQASITSGMISWRLSYLYWLHNSNLGWDAKRRPLARVRFQNTSEDFNAKFSYFVSFNKLQIYSIISEHCWFCCPERSGLTIFSTGNKWFKLFKLLHFS